MILYAYHLRHKGSQSGLTDLLHVMKIHMPTDSKLPKSKYLLQKALNIAELKSVKKHYFCPKCQRDIPLNAKKCKNTKCKIKIDFKKQMKKGFFYVHLNIKETLKKTLQMPSIAKNLLERVHLRNTSADSEDSVSDIMDGEAYQN